MLGLRRALLALFVVGVLFAGFDVALVLTSSHDDPANPPDAVAVPACFDVGGAVVPRSFEALVAGSGARGFISKGELSGAAIAELL